MTISRKLFFFTITMVLLSFLTMAQTIQILHTGTKISLRGLSVVNDSTIWVSGNNGTVGKSVDGGNNWKWFTVKGFEQSDFRDVKAYNGKIALIMSIAAPAYILRTTDGGENWKIVYENKDSAMFLDAMDFWNDQIGVALGDPINNKFFVIRTVDGGKTWKDLPLNKNRVAVTSEGCFASSGTNIRMLNKQESVFVSGGLTSHLFIKNKVIELPILNGKTTTGANSIAVKSNKIMVIVGGDFTTRDSANKNCVLTTDGGVSFSVAQTPPHGYRSCVEYLGNNNWLCTGLNGSDYSIDEGKNWLLISNKSFNACRKAKNGKSVFFAGNNGTVGKLLY